jgi:ribose-phosphate pyrophosphokinase
MQLEASKTVIVAPDKGGLKRVEDLAELLGTKKIASISKKRNLETGEIESMEISGKVEETAIIIDDIVSTGQTAVRAAKLLKSKGASQIYLFATHAVLSDEASKKLGNSEISKVFLTDTLEISKDKHFPKLEILPVAQLITEALR